MRSLHKLFGVAAALAFALSPSQAAAQSDAASAPLAPGALMNVIAHGGRRWAVIASVPAGAAWHDGAPALLDRDGVVVARANARLASLSPDLRALDGARVQLAGARGAPCTATLRGLSVLSRIDVHFSVEQRWNGEGENSQRVRRATGPQIARDVWGNGMLLVARLDGLAPRCASATAARLASLPAAPVFVATTADAALTGHALASFRALPAWATLQAQYQSEPDGGAARWDEHGRTAPAVSLWQVPGSARRFVTVSARVAVGGCAQFTGKLWAVFEATDDASWRPLTSGTAAESFEPSTALDGDGDGAPEFVVDDGVVRLRGAGYERFESIAAPNNDCDC